MLVILKGKDKKGVRVEQVTGGLTLFNSGKKTTAWQGRCSFALQRATGLTCKSKNRASILLSMSGRIKRKVER
jgi:hypothetical protein